MEQVLGMIYGLALGDALGAPVEFWELKGIRERYGPGGIQELPEPALFTDDTQMSLAVAEALVAAGHQDLGAIMTAISQEFVAWLRSPENDRSPGGSCLYGARQLEAGVPWWKSGKPNTKGCGAAMRVAPIGYLYQHDLPKLRQVAGGFGPSHPPSSHCPIGGRGRGLSGQNWPWTASPRMRCSRPWSWKPTDRSRNSTRPWRDLEEALEMTSPDAALAHIGEGWVVEEAVMMALDRFLKSPDDFLATIRQGANTQGDSDSIACIAGGISGAYLGIRALPPEWVERLEKSAYLADVARRLAAVKGRE